MPIGDEVRRAARDALERHGEPAEYVPAGGLPFRAIAVVRPGVERLRQGEPIEVQRVTIALVLVEEVNESNRGDVIRLSSGAAYEVERTDSDNGYVRTLIVHPE